MKNLITAIGSVMILMMFVSQFAANEMTYIRMFATDKIINDYEEEWQEEGKIDKNEVNKLKDELYRTFDGKVELLDIKRAGEEDRGSEAYDMSIKIYDVIGPYRLIEGSFDENAAVRTRRMKLKGNLSSDTDIYDPNSESGGSK